MATQEEVVGSFSDAFLMAPMAHVFSKISYATLGMPKNTKWPHTWAMQKASHRNKVLLVEEWDNIYDPKLKTNPKGLREAACERMKKSEVNNQDSLAYKLWFYGLP